LHWTDNKNFNRSDLSIQLSVFGATQTAQCKWHNGENNRLGLGLG